MSVENVKKYFQKWKIEGRILEFEESSATVELAAKAVNCEPKRIAKTISFMVNNKPILIVTAGDTKIDNVKFKQKFMVKANMIKKEHVVKLIGHEVGGVCPFAVNEGVDVFLDESLKRFDTIFPACGDCKSAIELTIPELEKYARFSEWVDVCKRGETCYKI